MRAGDRVTLLGSVATHLGHRSRTGAWRKQVLDLGFVLHVPAHITVPESPPDTVPVSSKGRTGAAGV